MIGREKHVQRRRKVVSDKGSTPFASTRAAIGREPGTSFVGIRVDRREDNALDAGFSLSGSGGGDTVSTGLVGLHLHAGTGAHRNEN